MNDKNREMFFSEESEYDAVITITDENDKDIDAEIIASIEVEELGKEYVAVLPLETPEQLGESEAIILEYNEDAEGNPVFSAVEDDDEFEIVSSAFNQFFSEEEFAFEEEEEGDYLDDLGEIIPGVSVKRD